MNRFSVLGWRETIAAFTLMSALALAGCGNDLGDACQSGITAPLTAAGSDVVDDGSCRSGWCAHHNDVVIRVLPSGAIAVVPLEGTDSFYCTEECEMSDPNACPAGYSCLGFRDGLGGFLGTFCYDDDEVARSRPRQEDDESDAGMPDGGIDAGP